MNSFKIIFCVFLFCFITSNELKAEESEIILSKWMLYSPEDRNAPLTVTLPDFLQDQLPEREINRNTYYYLEAKVNLPKSWQGKDLSLTFRDLPGITTLTVNDKTAPAIERGIAEYRGIAYRRSGPQIFWLNSHLTNRESLVLRLKIKRSWPLSDFIPAAPRLSVGKFGGPYFHTFSSVYKFAQIAITAIIAVIILNSLITFLLGTKQIENLYLAIQFSGPFVFMLFKMGYLQLFLGERDGPSIVLFLYMARKRKISYIYRFDTNVTVICEGHTL